MKAIFISFFLVSILIITMLGCDGGIIGEDKKYTDKPASFSFKIDDPTDNQKVEKLTFVIIHGTCDSTVNTKDILVYPLVKSPAPDGQIYPYYCFSINGHNWESWVFLGDSANKSGDIFVVSFCAVFKKDTAKLELAHVPSRKIIKPIGTAIPDYCTQLGSTLTLIIK